MIWIFLAAICALLMWLSGHSNVVKLGMERLIEGGMSQQDAEAHWAYVRFQWGALSVIFCGLALYGVAS